MAQRTGLEPATLGVTGRYSNQLNYRCTYIILQLKYKQRVIWIKWRSGRDSNPRPSAWQADILTNWTTAALKTFNVKAWWALTGSNRRHSACKADALPTELSALYDFIVCVVHYRESMQPVKRFSACFEFFMFEWLKNRWFAIKTNNFCNLFRILLKNTSINRTIFTQKIFVFLNKQ